MRKMIMEENFKMGFDFLWNYNCSMVYGFLGVTDVATFTCMYNQIY